jgi:UDP-N-acetylglucosamine:LPS N-acetylglucosamine transferase
MFVKIEIVYFNAGGGHRAAAKALENEFTSRGEEVILTNLFDVIDVKKLFQKITGKNHEDVYNKVLASGFTIGLGPQLKVLQAFIKTQKNSLVRKLRKHWSETQPDIVISVIPNFNRALSESLSGPLITILTDMADLPPHFWIEPDLPNQHVICGTEMAAAQAIVAGVPTSRVHRVQGMILRPAFYEERESIRNESPVGFVMFGGIGSKDMIPIAKKLHDCRLILVCGKNEKLVQKLLRLGNPKHQVVGFSDRIPELMASADYFIGKPGPGSISEAVQMGLPVIVPLNAFTMPQERWNCKWVIENNLGLVVKNFKNIDFAVSAILEDLDRLKTSVSAVQNTAILEIPDVVTAIKNVT